MKGIVVDNSIAAGWFIPSQGDARKLDILQALAEGKHGHMIVPTLWQFEALNAVMAATRRKLIPSTVQPAILDEFGSVERELVRYREIERASVARLCLRYNLTAYDAAYLDVALREGLPLATDDGALIAAAKHAKVKLL